MGKMYVVMRVAGVLVYAVVFVCFIIALRKTEYVASMKKYSPKQRKNYVAVIWACLFFSGGQIIVELKRFLSALK